FERSTIWADVDVIPEIAGPELRVYTAHWKSGSASRDNTLRINQATADAAHITAAINETPTLRIFYAGDLNEDASSTPVNILKQPSTTLSRISVVDPNNNSPTTRWVSGRTIDHMFRSATLDGYVINPFIFHTETFPNPANIPAP